MLTTIQKKWLKYKVIEFGTVCSKAYFTKYAKKNPDALAIITYINNCNKKGDNLAYDNKTNK